MGDKTRRCFCGEEVTTECPRCRISRMCDTQAHNALSRADNETYVCSPCGRDEALSQYLKHVPTR